MDMETFTLMEGYAGGGRSLPMRIVRVAKGSGSDSNVYRHLELDESPALRCVCADIVEPKHERAAESGQRARAPEGRLRLRLWLSFLTRHSMSLQSKDSTTPD